MRHPDGVLALLGQAGIVGDKDPLRRAEGLCQSGAVVGHHGLVIPGALTDELLEGLVGVSGALTIGEVDPAAHGLDALAFAVEQEALQVGRAVDGLLGVPEVVAEASSVSGQAVENGGCEFGGGGAVHISSTNRPGRSFVMFNGVVLILLR